MNRGPEVLAPAGSMDALRAAVECGADAVYLGAGHFNARRNAKRQKLLGRGAGGSNRILPCTGRQGASDPEHAGLRRGTPSGDGPHQGRMRPRCRCAHRPGPGRGRPRPRRRSRHGTPCLHPDGGHDPGRVPRPFRPRVHPGGPAAGTVLRRDPRHPGGDAGHRPRTGNVHPRRALHVRLRPVLPQRHHGRTQREPGPLCPALPPALFRRRRTPLRPRAVPPGPLRGRSHPEPVRGRGPVLQDRRPDETPGVCGRRGQRLPQRGGRHPR